MGHLGNKRWVQRGARIDLLSNRLALTLPGVLAGSILAFAKPMGEFGATITFVSNIPGETQTLSLALHNLLQQPGHEASALRLIMISVILAMGALLVSELLARRIKSLEGKS